MSKHCNFVGSLSLLQRKINKLVKEDKTIFEFVTPGNISCQFSLDHIIHLDQFFS